MPRLSQEDYVIVAAMAFGFIGSGWMFLAHFPPAMIATALAVAVAALVYRFLGGVGGTSFTIGNLKVVGAGALLIGAFYWIDRRLSVEMPITPAGVAALIADQREQLDALKSALGQAKRQVTEANAQTVEAQRQRDVALQKVGGETAPKSPTADQAIEVVRTIAPGSPQALALLAMEQAREGPWHVDLVESKVSIRGANYLTGRRVAACPSLHFTRNTVVDVTSLLKVNGTTVRAAAPVKVTDWDLISAADCSSDPGLQIQMGCQALVEIFTDEAVKCDPQNRPLLQNGLTNDFPAAIVVN